MGQGIEEEELRRLVARLHTLLRFYSSSVYHIRFLGREGAGQAHQIAYIHVGEVNSFGGGGFRKLQAQSI